MEGFTLGCDEGIDDTDGAEDTEGCADGSVEANSVTEEEPVVMDPGEAFLIALTRAASVALKSWFAQEFPHSVFCSAIIAYFAAPSSSSNLMLVVSLASIKPFPVG